MRESKHRAMVEQIVQILAQRAMAGGHTYLKKVRSHTGIHGNDEADRLAKEATDPKTPIDIHVTHGETAHEGMAWPSTREEVKEEGPNTSWSERLDIFKRRWGKFWNKKLAQRYRMRYASDPNPAHDANCPICNKGIDGASHILAGCHDK